MKVSISQFFKIFTLIAFVLVGTSSMTSCQKKGCTDPTSDNFDTEAEEDDDSCEDPRVKFIGSYNATETGGVEYPLTINNSSSDDRTIILNSNYDLLDANGDPVPAFNLTATVSQSSITITTQNASGVSFSGTGTITGTTLTFTYTITAGGSFASYTSTAVRQ